jgi:hypothetical protein
MATTPQENAIGVDIIVTVLDTAGAVKNISTATAKQLIFKKSNGTVVAKTATFVTDGSDGKLKWTTIAGDLTPYGTYQVQAAITMPGFEGRGKPALFDVLKNL